jgi:hypothetical protein
MVNRKVKFFRAVDSDGSRFDGGFPRDNILENLEKMAKNGTAELDVSFGRRLIAKSLGKSTQGRHIVLYRISSDDLPMLYEGGQFRPLADVIEATADIAEPAHFAFFPDDVVGHLYNHVGPKQPNLSTYLFQTMSLEVVFDPIAREDILASIANAGGVRLFRFRARAEDLARFNGIGLDGMRALAEDNPIGDVEIVLRATTPDQKRDLATTMGRILPRLSRANRREFVENAKVALTDADALSEGREVDVFTDPIVLTQQVSTIPGQKRYLEEESAMKALEDAYQTVQGRFG